MSYDFDDLTIFLAVARTQNLSEAAGVVHKTPGALSLRLKKLEESLGVTLFVRNPRGLSLTPAGLDLVAHAEGLLVHARRMEAAMRGHRGERREVLRIASNSSGLRNIVAPLVGPFLQAHPARIVLHECLTVAGVDAVVKGEADLSFGLEATLRKREPEVEVIPAMFDRHLLVLNPKVPALAPLLDCAQVTLPEILSFPYVALSESMPMGRAMAERARALGLAYEPIAEMPSFALLLDIVLQGAGAAVVPRSAFDRFSRKTELETVPIGELWAFRPLAFALPKASCGSEDSGSEASVGSTGHGPTPLARAFVAFALEKLRDGHGRGLGAADGPN